MEQLIEERGKYKIAYYLVDITEEMKEKALTFAKDIILTDNQYSRMLPSEVRESNDVTLQNKIEIQRTYMGKLGEQVFLKYLTENDKTVSTKGMFEVYEGQENVDHFDFITKMGNSVDVKTGFREIHKRLLVNTQQFDRIPKDYYVAVKIDAEDIDAEQKLVDWEHISTATIWGYAEHSYMQRCAGIEDFGEGPARWLYYNKLLGIDRLLGEF